MSCDRTCYGYYTCLLPSTTTAHHYPTSRPSRPRELISPLDHVQRDAFSAAHQAIRSTTLPGDDTETLLHRWFRRGTRERQKMGWGRGRQSWFASWFATGWTATTSTCEDLGLSYGTRQRELMLPISVPTTPTSDGRFTSSVVQSSRRGEEGRRAP